MRNLHTITLAGISSALLFNACGDSGASGPGGNGRGGRVQLVPSIHSTSSNALAKVAPSGAAGLESFQVAIAQIVLAKDLETQGSGFSNLSGTLNLFNQDLGDFNAIDTTMARDPAWRSHYFDFCNPADIARLSRSNPFTIRDTGSYNWVVVNWAPFFRVRATIPLSGGDTLYTHDGPITRHLFPNSTRDDAFFYRTRPQVSLLTGPSEEALVRKNNGGTWFRFMRPLRLTEADLDTNTTVVDSSGRDSLGNTLVRYLPSGRWNVLLVFNPQDFLFGGLDDSSNSSVTRDILSADSAAYVNAPFLKATAVPYRDGETVQREIYEFAIRVEKAWANGTYGMRLELYLIGDNVVAVTVQSFPLDGSFAPPEVPVLFFAEEKEDGSLSLQDYSKRPVFDGFVRKAVVGESGSVRWDPGSHAQEAQELSYRLVDIRQVR